MASESEHPKSPIDLDSLVRPGRMQDLRATAIEQYAKMESALAQLLAHLAGTSEQVASIIYFTIISTRARNTIIAKLLNVRHGTKFDVHWHGCPGKPGQPKTSGLLALIRQTDEQRNNIVHWRTTQRISGGMTLDDELVMPDFWYRAPDSRPDNITVLTLEKFILKTEFVLRSINMFTWAMSRPQRVTPDALKTWHEIFQQPALYPPLDSHPLSPNYKAPENPP